LSGSAGGWLLSMFDGVPHRATPGTGAPVAGRENNPGDASLV
jgi:hypothetical protein